MYIQTIMPMLYSILQVRLYSILQSVAVYMYILVGGGEIEEYLQWSLQQ